MLDEVAKLDSYTEISASARGLHVLVWSEEGLDNINRQQQHAEIHFRNKMFALSGNVFEGRNTIQRRSLADLIDEFRTVRAATLSLFQNLSKEAWTRTGTANNNKVSVRALAYIIAGHELHHRNIFKERYFGGQARAGIA